MFWAVPIVARLRPRASLVLLPQSSGVCFFGEYRNTSVLALEPGPELRIERMTNLASPAAAVPMTPAAALRQIAGFPVFLDHAPPRGLRTPERPPGPPAAEERPGR